ncbi:MAG: protein-glutamate O-methyltransferase CheR [Succinivibrionaceae bacterium]|nr:protein-glutamate O-methyltransferase CheR [Succinivibrionaceae bacterium]
MESISNEQYNDFCNFLEQQSGIVLGTSKQYLIVSRLSPLVSQFNLSSISELIEKAMNVANRQVRLEVIDAMTTNETLWFRDGYPYEMLKETILPELAKTHTMSPIKIWSAASSSGQEPYSIAMTCFETNIPRLKTPAGVQIVGTDISPTMLSLCKQGMYDYIALNRGLSAERKKLFFTKVSEQCMSVNEEIKRLVNFKLFNLLDHYGSMGKFDVIFCRNVLIYFSPQVKSKIINQLAQSLNPNGYLFLGASESVSGLTDRFDMERNERGIVFRLKD